MRFGARIAVAVLSCSVSWVVWAQGRSEERGRPEEPSSARRQAPTPQQFKGHPPGEHPHGQMVRPHPVRVLPPKPVVRGRREWPHWNHPEIARPLYYWSWGAVHGVACVAEDSYGDQYPVTETVSPGFGPDQMTAIEDDALDRCYAESGQDPTCYLASCSHFQGKRRQGHTLPCTRLSPPRRRAVGSRSRQRSIFAGSCAELPG